MLRDEAGTFGVKALSLLRVRSAGQEAHGTGPGGLRYQPALLVVIFAGAAFGQHYAVTAVRTWTLAEATRVAIEVSGPFEYKYDRLHNPERVYFDIKGATPAIEGRRIWNKEVTDKLVQRIRVAETNPGVTRVVLDVSGMVDVAPSQLSNPNRLMIELREAVTPPPVTESAAPRVTVDIPKISEPALAPEPMAAEQPVKPTPVKAEAPVKTEVLVSAAELAKAARPTAGGASSLTRALGLKLNRIVLDAGHGGHDQGTAGPKGLLEKELVLDVTLRLGKLIEQGIGAEVIYTRSDDTFVPLEGRTSIANEKKADLFLSIHANASSAARVTGVECYYLNFTESKEAMELAGRENATAQQSIFDLETLTHKIALHEKLDESREFASRVQSSLFAFSARSFPGQKNRGVRKAPFVVLIGASMPSVLVEIGFVSNPREEQLLKKADYRQKLAESLYKGVSKYAESLSHFQVAQTR